MPTASSVFKHYFYALIRKGNILKRGHPFLLSSYLAPSLSQPTHILIPHPLHVSSRIGNLLLLHRYKKDYERGKESAMIAG